MGNSLYEQEFIWTRVYMDKSLYGQRAAIKKGV